MRAYVQKMCPLYAKIFFNIIQKLMHIQRKKRDNFRSKRIWHKKINKKVTNTISFRLGLSNLLYFIYFA